MPENVKRLYNYEFVNKTITLISAPKQVGPQNNRNERLRGISVTVM